MLERFLVMGATGVVGRQVLAMLRSSGHDAIGASRNMQGNGWVSLDLLDPATHTPALTGITTVMLIARPGDDDAHLHAEPLIKTMVTSGVRRVVLLSAIGAERRPEFSLRKVEMLIEQSGLQWTHVRPNFFMQMVAQPPLSTEIALHGTLSLPLGDSKIAYVDARDVAATLVMALTNTSHVNRAITLSGPESLDHHAIAAAISKGIGRPVHFKSPSDDATRDLMVARGFPSRQVERVLAFYEIVRGGLCAPADTEVAQHIGRPLGRWSEFISENVNSWSPILGPK